jgi:hypothetical protein
MVIYASNPDDCQIVGGRRYGEIASDFADWFNRNYANPPLGLTREDVFHLGCIGHLWLALAKHARVGGLREETIITASCCSVMMLAGLPHEEWRGPRGWQVWGDYLDWYRLHMVGPREGCSIHSAAVRAAHDRMLFTVLRGLLWNGDIAKAYAEAAKQHARGKWSGIRDTARGTGVTSGFAAPRQEEDEILAALESIRMTLDSPLSRRANGQLIPSFGPALDRFKSDRPARRLMPQSELEQFQPPAADAASELEGLRLHREFRAFERFLRTAPARKCRSEYAHFMTAYAWDLLTGRRNPEDLAREYGKCPRVMRREWARHLDRLERDPRWGGAVRRARRSG